MVYQNSNNLIALVDLSTYCNAQCPQCHRTNQANITEKQHWLPLVQIGLEEFKKRFPIEDLSCYHELIMCGTWGDPVMAKDIYEICEYILKSDPVTRVKINTNGGMRNEEFWFKLGALNYKYQNRLTVIFDIDGITEEQHAKYRRNVSLAKVLQHLESYTAYPGSNAGIFTVVFEHNENDIDAIADLGKKHGAKWMHICPSNRWTHFTTGNKQRDVFRFFNGEEIETLERSKTITRYTSRIL